MNIKILPISLIFFLTTSLILAQGGPVKNDVIKDKFDLANKMYEEGEYKGAVKELSSAINLHKKPGGEASGASRIHLHILRSMNYRELNEQSKAIQDLDTAITFVPYGPAENRPYFAKLYIQRGDINMDFQSYSSAVHDYTTAINFHHNISEPYKKRGYARVKLDDLEQALSDLDKAVSIDPDFENLYIRGTVRYYLSKYTEAITDMDKILAQVPHHPEALWMKGSSLTQLSRRKEGCQLLRKAAELGNEDAKRAIIKDCE